MSEKDEKTRTARPPRRAVEPMPWGKLWWRDYLANGDQRRLTYDQKGRFLDVWCFTHSTQTPGVMDEEDVRIWAGYDPAEWRKVREVWARLFDTRVRRGKWVLISVFKDQKAAFESARTRLRVAQQGVDAKRRTRNDLSTAGSTSGTPMDALKVQPMVDTDVRSQKSESEPDTTGKPDSESEATRRADAVAQTQRSRVGSAGTAGPSRESQLVGIVARALDGKGNGAASRGSA